MDLDEAEPGWKRIQEKPNKAKKGCHIRPNERKDLNNQSSETRKFIERN